MPKPAAALLLAVGLSGCATHTMLARENQALSQELLRMHAERDLLQATAPPAELGQPVDLDRVAEYLERAGLLGVERAENDVLVTTIQGENARFKLTAQLFPAERVLYLAVTDYVRLEDATSSQAMVLLLTQLAALNYELLLGKLQLNPRSGEITLSVELSLEDGLGFRTLETATRRLVRTADDTYPRLLRAARGDEL